MSKQVPSDRNPLAHDIRLLKLAEMYEEAYEGFVLQMATQVVDDAELQTMLMQLVDPADAHGERIAEELDRLNQNVGDELRQDIVIAALNDVIEVERAARDFYRSHAGSVHDREVRALFEELAEAEDRHHEIAKTALRTARRKAGLPEEDKMPASYASRIFPPPDDLGVQTEP